MKTFEVILTEAQCDSLQIIAQTRDSEINTDDEASVLIQALLDEAIEIETQLEKIL